MSSYLAPRIHAHIRARRRNPSYDAAGAQAKSKEYPRMPRIPLAESELQDISLASALTNRSSARAYAATPLSFSDISSVIGSALRSDGKRRPYPSGGAKYPIETYLFARRVDQLPHGIFHYEPRSNALEQLWDFPLDTAFFDGSPKDSWGEEAAAVIIFTAVWERSAVKYGDFSYLLGVLEAGHMSQNVLLAAAACNIAACPTGAFNDATIEQLLDIGGREQAVHAITLGKPL